MAEQENKQVDFSAPTVVVEFVPKFDELKSAFDTWVKDATQQFAEQMKAAIAVPVRNGNGEAPARQAPPESPPRIADIPVREPTRAEQVAIAQFNVEDAVTRVIAKLEELRVQMETTNEQ